MGKRTYKCYPIRLRERAVERMKLGESATRLAEELGVHRTTLYGWKRKVERRNRVRPAGKARDGRDLRIEELEAKVAQLEGMVGRQWLELDFFDSALRRIEGKRPRNAVNGDTVSTPKSAAGCSRKAD
jgi:transposase-like protein